MLGRRLRRPVRRRPASMPARPESTPPPMSRTWATAAAARPITSTCRTTRSRSSAAGSARPSARSKCSRGKYDQALAIREIKRLFADWAIDEGLGFAPPQKPHKEKVAVVGAGPAGLACAFYLTRLGYKPVVFEALKVAGGMMKVGIPDFRLPKDKLQAEIAVIEKAGVQIKLNSPVATIDELKEKGYAAVFIGSGAHQAQKLNIDGNELKGVLSGIDFLREVNLGKKINIGDDVVVVGGGSTAMDAARMARRLGARNVRLVYRRTRAEMPAQLEELVGAEEEGMEMDFLVNPLQIVGKAGKVSGIHCIKTELADFDDSGRRRPVPVDGQRVHHPRQLGHLLPGPETQPGPDRRQAEPGQARPYRRRSPHHGHQHPGRVRRRRRRQPLDRDRERGAGPPGGRQHRPLLRPAGRLCTTSRARWSKSITTRKPT